MARVKRGVASHARHKKVLKSVKGHKLGRSKLIRQAKSSLLHAGKYAYAGRKINKRDRGSSWIVSISAALSDHEVSYSKFISLLKKSNIELDRKVLSQIAQVDKDSFDKLVKKVLA